MNNKFLIKVFTAVAAGPASGFAQTATTQKPDMPEYYYTILALGMVSVILAIIMGFLIFGMGEAKEKKPKPVKESAAAKIAAKLTQKLSGAVPVEREQEVMLDHDFDGIKELDNKVPPWFAYLFYATIFFAIVYMIDYHIFGSGNVMAEEYSQEMTQAAQQRAELEKTGAFITEETVTLLNDEASIARGKKIFDANCVACHAAGGAGLVGPNLTDDYWIHGGGIQNVFKTIKYGVPAKGMISWQTQLNPKQMQEAASYIISIHGTNPPNPKQPEGVLYSAADSVKTASL